MAKKKSERYRGRLFVETLRVMDGDRILGDLVVEDSAVPTLGAARTTYRRVTTLTADNRPNVPSAISGSHQRFLEWAETQKRERRPRTIRQDGPHIQFPDFSIRAEKLLPIVRQALNGGMREIEYSNLRRLLGM
ncbi:hypothetical protein [Corynebacterium striatum]|uniref:hypothetical protein n=1 Tax=Corynebacterium striatum TaxID=43770 RepID=UPI003B5BF680